VNKPVKVWRKCELCGRRFKKGPYWKKFCTEDCRITAYWAKKFNLKTKAGT